MSIPRTPSCFDDGAVCKNHREINDPILHGPVSHGVGTACQMSDRHSSKLAEISTCLQLVPTMPPILAYRRSTRESWDFPRIGFPRLAGMKLTDGPGSTGKKRPESLICSFKLIHGTEGWTTTSILSLKCQSPCQTRNYGCCLLVCMQGEDFVHE